MRPIQLTMSAFGPYADIETIDFKKLNDRNIFLITGPTGAGKTTIFDGIAYAIYGKTSGSDRDQEHIRSDFAKEDILTYVELTFQLHGKEYYIKRIPKQYKKKTRGEGYTEQKSDAELKIIGENKIYTGVLEVDHKIKEVIGLTYEQFRQIVMIPQGEFRELLLAGSKERQEIFRKIFGTSVFKEIQNQLYEMSKKVTSEITRLIEERKTNIKNIYVGENEALSQMIVSETTNMHAFEEALQNQVQQDKEEEKVLARKVKILEEVCNRLRKDINEATENNQKFQKKSEIEEEKKQLEEKKEEIHLYQEKVNKSRKTLSLKGLEDNYLGNIEKTERKKKEIESLHKTLHEVEEALKDAEKKLLDEENKQGERQALMNTTVIYKGYIDKVKSYEDKKNHYDGLQNTLKKMVASVAAKKRDVETVKNNIKSLHLQLEEVRKASKTSVVLVRDLEKKETLYKKLNQFQPLLEELDTIRKQCKEQMKQKTKNQQQYQEQKVKLQEMQQNFYKGYAGFLAKELKKAHPCPVCGSQHHPNPAKMIENVPTQEVLQKEEEVLRLLDENYRKSYEMLEQLMAKGAAQKHRVDGMKMEIQEIIESDISGLEKEALTSFIKDKLKALGEEILLLRQQCKVLEEQQKREEVLTLELAQKNELLEEEEKQLEIISENHTKLYGEVQKEISIIETIEKELPEDIRTHRKLQDKIAAVVNKYELMEKAFQDAKEGFQQCKEKKTSLLKEKSIKEDDLKEMTIECSELQKKLEEEIIALGFKDQEDYFSAKLTEGEIEALDKKIKEYNESVKSNEDRYREIIEALKGSEVVDIKEIENTLKEKEEEKNNLNTKRTEVFARIKHNADITRNIQRINDAIGKQEKHYSVIGDLAKVARGDNREKITFESYVLAAYFDDIIEAANLRLGKMTGNRYEMSRIKEKGKGNAQSGLEIEVFDNYTGKARHIKSLSGGEKFEASLSLALGLADVVQSYAGGISLETMFIDEGFGTLDTKSLDSAIECLLELQNSGRLVGIISHVQELKDRIPTRLEIEQGVGGSKTRFIV
ncbi:SbcC/MukB-like Walker B domain-containing protein [Clostridium formicaceticum]|uniref:Nuclease SbcCD subunit C n=1 Tax=Clostridium formicaceticum TaxID=1497 RepID=A0AAC9RG76_9CLOT|nr:SMC family ATPase [Clostridium formicaceticum]AOY75912.1 hypothetical protein BJL90_08400 [Clostridium formicaceticum]ARE86256.1 Nuclease SbcCD subunit C [Clostridium formicaceticum]